MSPDPNEPEAKYTAEDLFTAYIAYNRRQKPLGGPGHETPEASWKTVIAEARAHAAKGSFQGTTLAEFVKHFDAAKASGV